MANLVKLTEFLERAEADLFKTMLESEGIPAITQADDLGGMRPDLLMVGRVRVLVPEETLQDANDLLKEYESSKDDFQFEADDPELQNADGSQSDITIADNPNIRRAYFAAFFGFFIFPIITQIYAVLLLVPEIKKYPEFTRRDRRRFWTALLFIIFIFSAIAWAISRN